MNDSKKHEIGILEALYRAGGISAMARKLAEAYPEKHYTKSRVQKWKAQGYVTAQWIPDVVALTGVSAIDLIPDEYRVSVVSKEERERKDMSQEFADGFPAWDLRSRDNNLGTTSAELGHQLKIRITAETMEWLRRRAKKNFRSATAEIQAILTQMMGC